MNVLIACEFSGIVRDAFAARGHFAVSCDLLPSEALGRHVQFDALAVLPIGNWDLLIAHPPCTYLCNAGIGWLYRDPSRWELMRQAAYFFLALRHSHIPRIAVENPIMHKYARQIVGEPPTQIVEPWQFGEPQRKKIGLWLKNLPKLTHTHIVQVPQPKFYIRKSGPRAGARYNCYFHQGKNGHNRSRFFASVAAAMAEQWG